MTLDYQPSQESLSKLTPVLTKRWLSPDAWKIDVYERLDGYTALRKAFKAQLLLDAVAEKVEVSVNQQELVEYIVASAQQYGMDPNAFAKAVDEAGQVPAMVSEVARRKALATLLEKAKVTDASGNDVDLSTLFETEDDGLAELPEESAEEQPVPVATPPDGIEDSTPHSAGEVAASGRLGTRSLFSFCAFFDSVAGSRPCTTTTPVPALSDWTVALLSVIDRW